MIDPIPGVDLERLIGAYTNALEAGRMEDAEAAVAELLAVAAQLPDESTPDSLLLDEAKRREATADWAGAAAIYQRMLAWTQSEDNDFTQFRAHDQLAMLHGLLGRHDAALEEARAAVVAAHRTDLPTLLFMALDGQALYALRTDRVPEASGAVSEALEQMEHGALYDLGRGRALILRGACRTALGEWPAAECDLEASWTMLQPQAAMAIAAGVHATLVRWWAVTARLRGVQGDTHSAVEGWQEAVACSRHVAALPQVSGPHAQSALARTLQGLGHALTALGLPYLAEEAFTESRSLRQAVGLSPFGPNEPTL
jgi:tetratricopeptide (TPR) repeat protein